MGVLFQSLIAKLDGTVYAEAEPADSATVISAIRDHSSVVSAACSPGFFCSRAARIFVLSDLDRSAVFRHIVEDRERRVLLHHRFDAVHDVFPHGMHFMGVGVGIQPIICGVQGLAHADTDAAAEVQVIGVKDQPDGYYRLAAAGSQYADTAFSSADLAVGVAGAFRKNGQMPPFFQPFGGFGEHVIVGMLGICGGKGSHEPDKTAENGVPEQGLLGDKVERVRGSHCHQHRIQIAAVVGGEDDGSALRDIFPPPRKKMR